MGMEPRARMSMGSELKDDEWDLIAEWIKENTCGCIYSSFTGKELRENIDEFSNNCKSCKGTGAVISFNDNKKKYELQKCDECDKYKNDKQAWNKLNPGKAGE